MQKRLQFRTATIQPMSHVCWNSHHQANTNVWKFLAQIAHHKAHVIEVPKRGGHYRIDNHCANVMVRLFVSPVPELQRNKRIDNSSNGASSFPNRIRHGANRVDRKSVV